MGWLSSVAVMKARQLYLNPVFAFGMALAVLGAGNWIVGAVQVTHYRALVDAGAKTGLANRSAGSGQPAAPKNTEILGRIHEEREKYDAARIKVDFFYVVLRGGLLLFFTGLGFSVFTLVRTLRRDAPAR